MAQNNSITWLVYKPTYTTSNKTALLFYCCILTVSKHDNDLCWFFFKLGTLPSCFRLDCYIHICLIKVRKLFHLSISYRNNSLLDFFNLGIEIGNFSTKQQTDQRTESCRRPSIGFQHIEIIPHPGRASDGWPLHKYFSDR